MQGEAGPAVGLISIQLGQCSLWEGDIGPPGPVLTLQLRGFPQPMPLPRACGHPHPFSQPLTSPSDQWSPPFAVPDACVVSELPPDAHILPTAATVNSAPPAALVSLGESLDSVLSDTQNWGKGVEGGETDAEHCLCPSFCGIGPECQRDVSRNGQERQKPLGLRG